MSTAQLYILCSFNIRIFLHHRIKIQQSPLFFYLQPLQIIDHNFFKLKEQITDPPPPTSSPVTAAHEPRPAHRDHHVRGQAQPRRAHRARQRRALALYHPGALPTDNAGQNLSADSATQPTMVDQTAQRQMFSGQRAIGFSTAPARRRAVVTTRWVRT